MNGADDWSSSAPFTVIIPAHNEAAVIGRTLKAMINEVGECPAPEIIVVCNGCSDDTAAQARLAAPGARVIEIEEGSKPLAMNTGLDAATAFPVLIVDADVIVSHRTLCAVADTLRDGKILAASPGLTVDTADCHPWVRRYYEVWQESAYLRSGVGGSGIYGLSEAGLRVLGRFPLLISDDGLVRRLFPHSQQKRVVQDSGGVPALTTIFAPRTLPDLISCESRWRAGDAELRDFFRKSGRSMAPEPGLPAPVKRSGPAASLFVYAGIKIAGRLFFAFNRLRGRAGVWHRDQSQRTEAALRPSAD